LDNDWVLNNPGATDEIILTYNNVGFIPNLATPVSFCIEQYGGAPQQIFVDWQDIGGNAICVGDVADAQCSRCIAIEQEDLTCDPSGYKFDFDFTNVFDEPISRLDVIPLNIIPNSISPPLLDFSGAPIQPGSTVTGNSILFDLPVTAGIFEFVLQATCPSLCQCVSDTIRVDIPECGCDPCEEVGVELNPLDPNNEYCCWTLDIVDVCDPKFFSGVKIDINPNAIFRSQAAGPGWIMQNPTPQSAIWKPLFATNNGRIPAGNSIGKIEFCLGNINSSADMPQLFQVELLDSTGVVACDTSLRTFCEPLAPGDCLIVLDDTVTCIDDNPLIYQYDWSVRNVANFTANFIDIYNISTLPSSGSVLFNPGTSVVTPGFLPGNTLSSPTDLPRAIISGLNPGDQFCYQLSLRDSIVGGVQQCCHTQVRCTILPECPPDPDPICETPCDATYIEVRSNVLDQDSMYCCHEMDLAVVCDTFDQYFTGIRLEALNGVIFRSLSAPITSTITNISPSEKVIKPALFNPSFPYMTPFDTLSSLDFCLGSINDPSQVPQQIVVHWLDTLGSTVCSDTLEFTCPPLPPGNCIVVLNDTVKCEPPGHYAFCFDIVNVGMFTGEHIRVENLHTRPAGGVFNPTLIDTAYTLGIGDTFSVSTIHLNGVGPGDTLCYSISIYDDPDPVTGYNNCCHTDTLCIVLPDCGDETVCDSVSWDTLSTQGECCFGLEINNNFSSTYFEALKLTTLNPGVIIASISGNADWNAVPCPGGYMITYTGPGAPFIPLGISVPLDFCVGGYTSAPQTLELTWLKSNMAGQLITECCQGLVINCEPPAPRIPCFDISELSSTCVNDSLKLHFKLMNNTNIGATSPGYPINRITFQIIAPASAGFVPDPMPISPPLAPGQMRTFTIDITGIGQGQSIHFSAGVHLVNDSTIECCTSDTTYCFVTGECLPDPPITYCDTLQFDSIWYEGWAVVTCAPDEFNPPVANQAVLCMMDIRNHESAPRDANWIPPTKFCGFGGTNWDFQTLGRIFGLAIDPHRGFVYTASSSLYPISSWQYGQAGRPAIYQIDLSSGAVNTIVSAANTCVPQTGPINQIPNGLGINNDAPAFGNLAFNEVNNLLYVSNLEDGHIYIIDPSSNSVIGGFDPWSADDGTCGIAPLGQRIYGLQYHRGHQKLYFGRSTESLRDKDALRKQEIWSVDLSGSGMILAGSEQPEFQLPDYQLNYSAHVMDIAFNAVGSVMMIAERGYTGYNSSHQARLLEYRYNGVQWVAEPISKFSVGKYNQMTNSAGGVDFTYRDIVDDEDTCDSTVVCTGNALHLNGTDRIYGLQGTPVTGGDVTNSFLIDYAGGAGAGKASFGDVEVFRNMCCSAPPIVETCCTDSLRFVNVVVPATNIINIGANVLEVSNLEVNDCHEINIFWGDGTQSGPISGASLPVTHTLTTMDSIYQPCVLIREINADGEECFGMEYCDLISSTQQIESSSDKRVYPNPTTGQLFISSEGDRKWINAIIYNKTGQEVLIQELQSDQLEIDVRTLTAGLYFINLRDENGELWTTKFMKL